MLYHYNDCAVNLQLSLTKLLILFTQNILNEITKTFNIIDKNESVLLGKIIDSISGTVTVSN